MERRVFLAILLSFLVLLGWQFIGPKVFPQWFPPPPEPGAAAPQAQAPAPAAAPAEAPAIAAEAAPAPAAGDAPEVRPEEKIVLENEVVRATFTSRGAAVASWVLKGKRFEVEREGEPVHQLDLVVPVEGLPPAFSTSFDPLGWPTNASYEVVSSDKRSVTFRATGGGATVTKRFSLSEDHYDLAFDLQVADAGGGARKVSPTVHLPAQLPEEKKGGGFFSRMLEPMPDMVQLACAYDGELERRAYDEDETLFTYSGGIWWAGVDSRYFLTAVFPGRPAYEAKDEAGGSAPGTCTLRTPDPKRYEAQLSLDALQVPGEGQVASRLTGYLGPKFKTELSAYGHRIDDAIDFGFFTVLSLGLLWIMVFFQGLVANWGVAIILLTVSVKLVLLPLTNWSMKSMEKMRAIQPKMSGLKEKFGKDPQRYQQEMMKLYREEGVSPFGGCLPMLLQLPIWFALYRTILATAELYQASFIPGWLEDLASPEPGLIKILPLAMGVTMFLMQKMQPTPQAADETQARMQKYMLYFMPPFFTFIMYGLPSGLTLYIFVNNLLSIAQQYWIRKRMQPATAAKA